MYIVLLTYLKPLEELDLLLQAHRAFLDEQYKQNKFLLSGPRNPRTGGVIVANVHSLTELEEILKRDPFYQQSVVSYETIHFIPTKYHSVLETFICE